MTILTKFFHNARLFILFISFILMATICHAADFAYRYPTKTPLEVYTPTSPQPESPDEKVKYNVSDALAGYLFDKTVAGAGITLSEGTGADVDKLKITSSSDLSVWSYATDPMFSTFYASQNIANLPARSIRNVNLKAAAGESFTLDGAGGYDNLDALKLSGKENVIYIGDAVEATSLPSSYYHVSLLNNAFDTGTFGGVVHPANDVVMHIGEYSTVGNNPGSLCLFYTPPGVNRNYTFNVDGVGSILKNQSNGGFIVDGSAPTLGTYSSVSVYVTNGGSLSGTELFNGVDRIDIYYDETATISTQVTPGVDYHPISKHNQQDDIQGGKAEASFGIGDEEHYHLKSIDASSVIHYATWDSDAYPLFSLFYGAESLNLATVGMTNIQLVGSATHQLDASVYANFNKFRFYGALGSATAPLPVAVTGTWVVAQQIKDFPAYSSGIQWLNQAVGSYSPFTVNSDETFKVENTTFTNEDALQANTPTITGDGIRVFVDFGALSHGYVAGQQIFFTGWTADVGGDINGVQTIDGIGFTPTAFYFTNGATTNITGGTINRYQCPLFQINPLVTGTLEADNFTFITNNVSPVFNSTGTLNIYGWNYTYVGLNTLQANLPGSIINFYPGSDAYLLAQDDATYGSTLTATPMDDHEKLLNLSGGTAATTFGDGTGYHGHLTSAQQTVLGGIASLTPGRVTFMGATALTDDADMTFSSTRLSVTDLTSTNAPIVSSLTAERVVFVGASKELVDDADFTFKTDTLAVTKIAGHSVTGDLTFTGAGKGLAFGSCYGNVIAWSQATATQNQWYVISDTDMTDGVLNLFTHDGSGKLTATNAGTYLVNFKSTSASSVATEEIQMAISVNGSIDYSSMSSLKAPANAKQPHSSSAIITLTAGQYIEANIRTLGASTPNLSVDYLSMTAVQIGG